MKRLTTVVCMAVLALAVVGSASAKDDPRIGTWKLNPSKSSASNGQLPASQTRTYEAQGSEIWSTVETTDAKGNHTSNHANSTADGKDHPGGTNTVSIKQTGPGAYAGTIKKDGKVIGTNTAVISGGGKVFTFKNKGTDAQGKAYTSTVVFDKQ